MVSFQQKELEHIKTIGGQFKKNRLAAGLSVEAVYNKINISTKYLRAIEEGEFDKLPGDIYVKNFLRVYADFLKLDYQKILKDYEFEKDAHQIVNRAEIQAFGKKTNQQVTCWYSFLTANLVKNLIIIVLIIASLWFLIVKVDNIVAPPILIISSPANNLTLHDNYIEIIGRTDVGAKVFINGQSVMISPAGEFAEGVNLQSGLNIIKISSSKKYSKIIDVYREVLVEK